VTDKRESHPLTLSKIEEILHAYFRDKSQKDETLEIMKYIRSTRGFSVNKILKQSGIPKPTIQEKLL
jgi:uncharacterized membrane protein